MREAVYSVATVNAYISSREFHWGEPAVNDISTVTLGVLSIAVTSSVHLFGEVHILI